MPGTPIIQDHAGDSRYLRAIRSAWGAIAGATSPFFKMWPVSLTIATLAFCFLIPGLANDQVTEALFSYVRYGDRIEISWARYALSLCAAAALSVVLRTNSRNLLRTAGRPVPPRYGRFLSIVIGASPLLLIAFAFVRLHGQLAPLSDPFIGLAAGLVAFYLAQTRFGILTRWLPNLSPVPRAVVAVLQARVAAWGALAFISSAFLLSTRDSSFGLPFSLISVAQSLGPVNIFLLSCCIWTSIVSDVVILARRGRIRPVAALAVAALVVAFGWLDLNDNHSIRRSPEVNMPTLEFEDEFAPWLADRPDRKEYDVYPVILVSAEGGGIRAAYFTAMVLARLVDACPGMAQHIYGISGVSGGSVGAAVFAAAMKVDPPDTAEKRCEFANVGQDHYQNKVAAVLSQDHLSPLLAKLLFVETVQQFLPFPISRFDRQLGLEYSLERSFLETFGKDTLAEPLYALRPSKDTPSLPNLFLNATRARDGRRLIMSPSFVKAFPHGGFDDWHAIDYRNGPPLSAAAGTSARFPFISPPGSFTDLDVKFGPDGTVIPKPEYKGRKDQYVDGGYFDNSGTPTLVEVYRHLQQIRTDKDAEEIYDQRFSVLTIHIGNAPYCGSSGDDASPVCKRQDGYANHSGLVSDFLTALETVMSVRDFRVEYGLNDLKIQVSEEISRSNLKSSSIPPGVSDEEIHRMIEESAKKSVVTEPYIFDRYTTVQMADRGIPVPLGWLLSRRAVDELRLQLNPREESLCNRGFQREKARVYARCDLDEILDAFRQHGK
ncbi:patatin-like phospholipase family protein [Bradyrhizobium sp. HKCCYLS20291]|uniref:patatin-like phospholipase family protein n=1 Tax=Bradyrhizobium sp. HKCCYLS20291 TaxID=3420766 RepID=UPI003EB81B61